MERDLTERSNLDHASREEWSIAASEALIHSQKSEVIIAIAQRGLMEFVRVSKPIYEGHGFRFEDYRRMFERIQWASARLRAGKGLGPLAQRLVISGRRH